jgi:hypothetical protein
MRKRRILEPAIVGIDAGTKSMGMTVWSQQGSFTTWVIDGRKATGCDEDRHKWLLKRVMINIEPGDFVITEGLVATGFGRSLFLIELMGIIKLYIKERTGNLVCLVAPTSLKKFACSGNAKKDEIRLAAFKTWGVEFGTTDELDSWLMAKLGTYLLGLSPVEELTAKRQEVVRRSLDGFRTRNYWKEIKAGFDKR